MNRKGKKLEEQEVDRTKRKIFSNQLQYMCKALGMSRVLTPNLRILLTSLSEFITENHPQDDVNWRTRANPNCLSPKGTHGSFLGSLRLKWIKNSRARKAFDQDLDTINNFRNYGIFWGGHKLELFSIAVLKGMQRKGLQF